MKTVVILALSAVSLGTILGLFIFYTPTETQQPASISAINIGVIKEINITENQLVFEQLAADILGSILLNIEDETVIVQKISSKNQDGVIVSWKEEPLTKELIAPGDRATISWFIDEKNERFVVTKIEILKEISVQ